MLSKLIEKKRWFDKHKVMKMEDGEFIFYRYKENGRYKKNYLKIERFIWSIIVGILGTLAIIVLLQAMYIVFFRG